MTRSKKGQTRHIWTPIEIAILCKFYADMPTSVIADALGLSIEQVYHGAQHHGLRKSDTFLASSYSGRLTDGSVGIAGRFQKGIKPWNTGTKGLAGQHPNSRKTQFKKGQMSGSAARNYVPIGSLRINRDGYLDRKVTDDPNLAPVRRWVGVHRLVWEAEHGPIPKGHMVAFRPGMRTTIEDEITVDRLECITLAENMKRNSLHNYPKEIAAAILARAVLNRRINRG